MKKADLVREKLPQIAEWRMPTRYRPWLWTWREIAEELTQDGLSVTEDEIRSYWGRFTRGRDPREVLHENGERLLRRAVEAEANLLELQQERDALRERVVALEGLVTRLQDELVELRSDLASVNLMQLGIGRKR